MLHRLHELLDAADHDRLALEIAIVWAGLLIGGAAAAAVLAWWL